MTGEPVVRVAALGAVTLRTPALDAMLEHYIEGLGLEQVEQVGGTAYLTTGPAHHCLVLEPGSTAQARTRVAFQLHGSIDDAAQRLRHAGIEAERRNDPEPGIAEALALTEPGGTPLLLYAEMEGSGVAPAFGVRPTGLGHVAAFVPKLSSMQRFYEEVLGFRWSDTIGDFFVFLRCGPDHHTVNFIQSSERRGMHHVAFEARDFMHMKDLTDHLASRGTRLDWGPGRHGVGHNLFAYHRDPDGNSIEIFAELDRIADEATGRFEPRPWHETFPQGPRVWEPAPEAANKWGPVDQTMNTR